MSLETLEQQVIQWAEDRSIFQKATPYKQAQKTLEECGELLYAIGKQDNADISFEDASIKEEVADAIGDVLVTLAIQAKMQDLTLEECFQSAYNEIKDRTGSMVNGQFQKNH